jgi:acetyltransferase-like isoleucine patch superfamily enzyme
MLSKFRTFWKKRAASCDAGVVLYPEATIVNMRRAECIRIGAFTHVRGELLTFAHGGEIRIGKYCYIGEHCKLWSAGHIHVGDRVLIAHAVTILDNLTHPLSASARHNHYRHIMTNGHPKAINLDEQPVEIGDDVWIGCMSVILRGVTIGQGAIIGAGSVVTSSIPPWTVIAGNPARIIRELTPAERA